MQTSEYTKVPAEVVAEQLAEKFAPGHVFGPSDRAAHAVLAALETERDGLSLAKPMPGEMDGHTWPPHTCAKCHEEPCAHCGSARTEGHHEGNPGADDGATLHRYQAPSLPEAGEVDTLKAAEEPSGARRMKPTARDWEKARDVRDAWCGDNPEVLSQTQGDPLSQHIAQAIADERERCAQILDRRSAELFDAADRYRNDGDDWRELSARRAAGATRNGAARVRGQEFADDQRERPDG